MKADRLQTINDIQTFIDNPENELVLSCSWVAQIGYEFPKHLADDEGRFLCGTQYTHEENTDGTTMKIALTGNNKANIPTHSVNFMFSEMAQFVLCKKCLKWLREQLQPLKTK